ncbi:MAG: hypothetical protein OEM00_05650 [Burkholderiaceae bacterium]|nr:hypothetical protein [Burkholderiaceae bacterium]
MTTPPSKYAPTDIITVKFADGDVTMTFGEYEKRRNEDRGALKVLSIRRELVSSQTSKAGSAGRPKARSEIRAKVVGLIAQAKSEQTNFKAWLAEWGQGPLDGLRLQSNADDFTIIDEDAINEGGDRTNYTLGTLNKMWGEC